MGRGWDVLLRGERAAVGRMDLGDGRRVRGVVRRTDALGVGVRCEVLGEGPLGTDDVLENTLKERGGAGVLKGTVRAVA
ncbi:MAG: hypothetical protein ACO3PY_06520 [Pontimonas sp.]